MKEKTKPVNVIIPPPMAAKSVVAAPVETTATRAPAE